jgi:hypothetical protein
MRASASAPARSARCSLVTLFYRLGDRTPISAESVELLQRVGRLLGMTQAAETQTTSSPTARRPHTPRDSEESPEGARAAAVDDEQRSSYEFALQVAGFLMWTGHMFFHEGGGHCREWPRGPVDCQVRS